MSDLDKKIKLSDKPPKDVFKDHTFNAYLVLLVLVFFLILVMGTLMAQGISVGGTDNSGQMKDVQNLITTLQSIAFKWVAKIIGGFLVIQGIYKIASRDFMSGITSTAGGGSLFFVEKIVESLSKMGGNN